MSIQVSKTAPVAVSRVATGPQAYDKSGFREKSQGSHGRLLPDITPRVLGSMEIEGLGDAKRRIEG
jgi:hypothetical protein